MEIDEKELKALEAEMAERVETEARKRIMRNYGTPAFALIAALSYIGISGTIDVRQATQKATTDIKSQADKFESSLNDQVANLISQKTREADKLAGNLEGRLDASLDRADELIANIRTRIQEATDLEKELDKIKAEISASMEETIKQAQNNISELSKSSREREQAEIVSLQIKLQDQLGAIIDDLDVLGQRVSDIEGIEKPKITSRDVFDEQSTRLDTLVDKNAATSQSQLYIQFAGSTTRAEINQLRALLEGDFSVPPAERLSYAAGLNEVRYFHASDKNAAQKAANDVSAALAQLGFATPNIAVRFLDVKTKPKQNTIELWIEPTKG